MSDSRPGIDPTAPLQFVINAVAGSNAGDEKRQVIEAALDPAGRQGNLLFSHPADLAHVAQQAATLALATRTAIVAMGGRRHAQHRGACRPRFGLPYGGGATRHAQLLCPHPWHTARPH